MISVMQDNPNLSKTIILPYFFVPKIFGCIFGDFHVSSIISFQPISKFDMEKKIQNINLKKATIKKTILPKMLKVSCNTSTETFQSLFNECLTTGNSPDNLKLWHQSSFYEVRSSDKENYRLFSVCLSISKAFGKIMQDQINDFVNNFFYHLTCAAIGEVLVHS